MGANKRVALKPHAARIREWVGQGRNDGWIAQALGTSASSVESGLDDLVTGREVEYEVGRNDRGPVAVGVRPV